MCFQKQSPAPYPPNRALNARFPFLPKTELVRAAPGGEPQVVWEFLLISSAVITKLGDYTMRHIRIQTNKKIICRPQWVHKDIMEEKRKKRKKGQIHPVLPCSWDCCWRNEYMQPMRWTLLLYIKQMFNYFLGVRTCAPIWLQWWLNSSWVILSQEDNCILWLVSTSI